MECNIAENNGRSGNGQHPSISRFLPLFDVQIFTMPRRACLRGSCRCVGVLFASGSPRVFVSKIHKAAVFILLRIVIPIFTRTTDLSGNHLVHSTEHVISPQVSARVLRCFRSLVRKTPPINIYSPRKFPRYF